MRSKMSNEMYRFTCCIACNRQSNNFTESEIDNVTPFSMELIPAEKSNHIPLVLEGIVITA